MPIRNASMIPSWAEPEKCQCHTSRKIYCSKITARPSRPEKNVIKTPRYPAMRRGNRLCETEE